MYFLKDYQCFHNGSNLIKERKIWSFIIWPPLYVNKSVCVCVCARMYLCAVVVMASTTSMILCKAESVPIVMSVPQKSLSMEPTIPTMFKWDERLASSAVILPAGKGKHNEDSKHQKSNFD